MSEMELLKEVLDITSRVDERVKVIQSGQSEIYNQLNDLNKEVGRLNSRVSVLESKNGGKIHEIEDVMQEFEIRIDRLEIAQLPAEFQKTRDRMEMIDLRLTRLEDHRDGWVNVANRYTTLFVQGIWVIIICYLLYKLGITTPPLP